ncbi:H-NS histone family protein [Polaromonas sp. YR568]|uniref:H-NS histone family protein n=1 Tax=Polaromonas sp. YR568 TaxID=1855301 RepID=UPI0031378E90
MSSLSELQQQIAQAEAKVNELREKLAQQKNSERTQAIASAKELIQNFQLSATELGLSQKPVATRKAKAPQDKRSAVAAKYRDPISGKTWTGRGKTPAWLAANIAAGHSKQDYLIK